VLLQRRVSEDLQRTLNPETLRNQELRYNDSESHTKRA